MPSINDIRLQFPDSTAGKTDLDIAADFAKFNNVPLERAAFDLGVSMPNAPGFASTLKRSAAQMTGGLGEIYGDVSGDHNNALATWSRGVEQSNPSGINSFQDIADNPGLALAEATANGLTFLVPAKGLQLAGQGLKAAKYLNAARAVDNPVSQAALAGLPSLAGIGEDQRASGQGENLLMKYGGAGVVGAIENLGGIQRLAGINRAAPGIQETVNSFGKTPWRTVGKTVGRSMLEEGAEELAQNPIEQWAGYKDPTTSQNMYETALGGAMGALGGLGFGAYHGGRSGMQHSAIRRDIATDLLNTEQSFGRQQNLAQWESAFRNKAGEDGQQWYGDFMNTQNDARLANTTTWNEPLADYQQRVAEAGNPFMGEGPTADFVNRQLGIGQKPVQQHYASAYNQRLPEPVIVPDSNGNPITISTVGEAYDYQHGMGKFAPQQAKVDALGYPVSQYQPVEATQTQAAAPSWEQFAVNPAANIAPMPAAPAPLPMVNVDGVLTPVQQGTNAPQTQQVAPQAVATPAAQTGSQQTAAPAAQDVKQTTPRGAASQAFESKLNTAVTEGKIAQDDPIIADWHASKKLKADAVSFGQALDDKLAGPNVAPLTAEQALQQKAASAVAEVKGGALNLTMKQIPVFDHVQKAFAENRIDDVIGADGKWKYAEIGKALGIERGQVMSRVDGMANKLAASQGISVEEMKAALRARTAEVRTTEMSEADKLGLSPKQQSSVFNEEDLFGNENGAEQNAEVINSVGGSQSEIGTSEAPTDLVLNRQDAPEVAAKKLQSSDRAMQEMLGELKGISEARRKEAMDTWNEYAESSSPQGVPFHEVPTNRQFTWALALNDFLDENADLPPKQFGEKLLDLYHEYSNDLGTINGPQQSNSIAESSAVAPQLGNAGTESQNPRLESPRQETSSEQPVVSKKKRRVAVADEAAGRSDSEGQAGEVGEKAQLQNDAGAESTARRSEGRSEGTGQGYAQAGRMRDTLKRLFFSPARFDNFVRIFQTEAEAAAHPELRGVDTTFAGLAYNGKVYLIADNIEQGGELGVFLHELGVHVGMEKLIGRGNIDTLARQIAKWSEGNGTSVENRLARIALHRLENAMDAREERGEEAMSAEEAREELLAYFTEEAVLAGINPQATSATPIGRFFRTLVAAMKVALRKIGLGRVDQLTAQNFVDLAFGAADMEMAGTWHGTAAEFRNFNHDYMGSGEGAQAFGWGSYLAQRTGIAKGYWKDDVRRKGGGGVTGGKFLNMRTGEVVTFDNSASWLPQEDLDAITSALKSGNTQRLDKALKLTLEAIDLWGAWKIEAYPTIAKSSAVEGALMRVRPLVHEDEMLDWDKPLSEQNKVRIALMPLRKFLAHTADELTGGVNWNDMTGAEMYHLVQRALQQDYFDPNLPKVDEALRQGRTDQAASEYLDSIGIKGIKFLDANSRDVNYSALAQMERDLVATEKRIAMHERNIGNYDAANQYPGFTSPDAWLSRQKDLLSEANEYRDELESDIERAKNPTRNLVIFNDKNLQRVTSQAGARRDSESIKFSDKRDINSLEHIKALINGDIKPSGKKMSPEDRQKRLLAKLGASNNPLAEEKAVRKMGVPRRSERRAATPMVQQTRDQFGKTGVQMMDDARDIVSRGFKWFMSLHDLVSEYKAQLPSASSWYDSVRATIATRNKMEAAAEAIAARAGKLKSEHFTQLNKFLAQSTLDQKWGYDATFTRSDGTKHVVKADPQMAQAFNRLPVEVQNLVKDIFAHGETMKDTKYTTMRELGIKDPVLQAGALTGPYAPLKRFGDHIVVLKSKELVAAEKAGDQKKVDELKKDGKHYVVSSFDTKGQAKAFERESAAKYESAVTFKGSEKLDLGHQMNTQTLQKLQASLKLEKIDKRAKEQFENLLKDMYLRAFDEHSARMSGLKRMNRAGFNEDMVRSFLSHARAEAGFLANMKHGAKTNEEYYKIEQEAKQDRYAGQDAFNAITQHYVANLEHKDTPIQDRVMALTTFQQLATNPAYHIQNLLQPVMVSVPRLAADFNNYAGAWTALRQGYAIVRKAVSGGLINDAKIDLSKVENQKLRDMLQAASDAGLLDVGMDEDLTKFESTQTGYGAVDKTSALMKKVVHKMRQTARRVEATNRISTAVAAFNMSYAKEADEAKATAYAISVLQDTQGDFSKTDAPLIIKKLPKFVVQYRKFQLMMAAHYVKAFRDMFHGVDLRNMEKDNSEEAKMVRAVGRRTLAISLGHAFMASGVMGLPLMNLVGLAFAASGDDDEPKDLERSLREWIGDADTANFLLHSPLYFMGLDAKLSQDKIFSILPYADWNLTSKKGVMNLGAGLAGPSGSNAMKMADGLGNMAKGEYYDGLIGLLPSGLSNGVKAFEMANKGYTLKNGDVMVKPEDINEFGLLMDSMGLKSPGTRRMDWYKNQQWEVKQFYSDRTKEIEHQYADAAKSGDTEKLSELRQNWQDLQAGKDHLRYIFGDQHDELKRQPLSNLLKYPQTQAKRERKLQKSVPQEL